MGSTVTGLEESRHRAPTARNGRPSGTLGTEAIVGALRTLLAAARDVDEGADCVPPKASTTLPLLGRAAGEGARMFNGLPAAQMQPAEPGGQPHSTVVRPSA